MSKFAATAIALAAFALPSTAMAHCAPSTASFNLSCENGVTVLRGRGTSAVPIGPSAAQVQLEIARTQAATARADIAARERSAARNADLRAREIENARYRNVLLERNTRDTTTSIRRRGYGYGFNRGFGFAQPIRAGH